VTGNTVTTTLIGVPAHPLAVGVTLYVTVANVLVVFMSVWAIVDPVPFEKPVAVPLVRAAVQENVAVPMLLARAIFVVAPLQID
jgi:hypothetical protein